MLSAEEKIAFLMHLEERERRRKTRRLFAYTPYPKQLEFHEAGAESRERLLMAGNQLGKEQRVDEPVLTPFGWRPIGSLAVGDMVMAGDGSITAVTGVFPQGIKPLVEMEFADGQKVISGNDHLWRVLRPANRFTTRSASLPRVNGKQRGSMAVPNMTFGRWEVLRTADMRAAYGDHPSPKYRFATPAPGIAQFPSLAVPVDPYFLGMLLGDGCLTKGICFTTTDAPMLSHFMAQIEARDGCVRLSGKYDYHATHCPSLLTDLRALGVIGKGAGDKVVPHDYLWNSPEVRLAVLQGLMDTDGTCEKSGITTFTSISKQLADDVVFLVRSFGGRCRVSTRYPTYRYKGDKRTGQLAYMVTIRCPHVQLFRLERKLARYIRPTSTTDHNLVVAFRDIDPSHAVCISVAHPSHTYITRDFIVTHNTWSMGFETAMHLTGRYPGPREVFYPDEDALERMAMHDPKTAAALLENLSELGLLGADVYPDGWQGHRFNRPIWIWAASLNGVATRDNPQRILIGPPALRDEWGTGAIPQEDLLFEEGKMRFSMRQGTSDAIDNIQIRHVSGGTSILQFKTYEQGREAWQGPTLDLVWFDEEPPRDIYEEGLTRTNRTGGPVVLTFTPLLGMSEVVRLFISTESTEEADAA